MMRPPHKLLAGMWREAEAVIGVLAALRDAEQAVRALSSSPAAPLTDMAAIAWAFEAPDGTAAIAQTLVRLRGTDAASARRIYPARSLSWVREFDPGFGPAEDTMPNGAIGGTVGAGNAPFRVRHDIGANKAALTATVSQRFAAPAGEASAALTQAARRAARQPMGASPASVEARRAVDLILNGLRPSAATLLVALDMAALDSPDPAFDLPNNERHAAASSPPSTQIARALTTGLAHIDAARGARAERLTAPMVVDPPRHNPSPPVTPAASGFRRLAALVAQSASGPAADPLADMPETRPRFAVAPASGAISRRRPSLPLSAAGEAGAAQLFPVARDVGEDVAAETEVAELLARVLRREARRQGIADEGGAA